MQLVNYNKLSLFFNLIRELIDALPPCWKQLRIGLLCLQPFITELTCKINEQLRVALHTSNPHKQKEKVKVKESRYRPGVAQSVRGS